jgi:hypothetical protein
VEYQSGSKVKVRLAGGKVAFFRVVRIERSAVYVTTEARWDEALTAGLKPTPLIGVPAKDVLETLMA